MSVFVRKFVKANIVSLIFNALFNLPIAFYKPLFYKSLLLYSSSTNILIEILIVLLINNLFFFLVFQLKYLSSIITTLLFGLGGVCTYFLIYYHKLFDVGVIIDLLTVENELVKGYIGIILNVAMLFSIILGCWLAQSKFLEKYDSKLIKPFVIINIFLVIIFFITFVRYSENPRLVRFIAKDYLPYNLYSNIYYFNVHYLPHLKHANSKINIPQQFPPKFDVIPKEPLVVVLIIGESMRGDLLSINGYPVDNMPLMNKLPNLISFTNATSSSTTTRISLPYMLTSAVPPNFEQALSEVSIISMFKALGFETSWIGTQGISKAIETTYASIVVEADYFMIERQISKITQRRRIYDGDIINIVNNRLKAVKKNHFMIIHLLGSHWNFNDRYPPDFKEKFLPSCKKQSHILCSPEMVLNGYYNTISYTDYVLSKIINFLKSRNSFLLYASDHGFTFENERFFGNSYLGDNTPEGQLNIGMFVWASDQFIKENKNNYQKILDKKYNPISHNYIYPSLLRCVNISSEIIDEKFNLCY